MLIGEDKNSIDLQFTGSKVKVTRVTFVKNIKMFSAHYLGNFLSQSFHISRADWTFAHYLKNYLSQSFHISRANWTWREHDLF